jgi:hypothetical protein
LCSKRANRQSSGKKKCLDSVQSGAPSDEKTGERVMEKARH